MKNRVRWLRNGRSESKPNVSSVTSAYDTCMSKCYHHSDCLILSGTALFITQQSASERERESVYAVYMCNANERKHLDFFSTSPPSPHTYICFSLAVRLDMFRKHRKQKGNTRDVFLSFSSLVFASEKQINIQRDRHDCADLRMPKRETTVGAIAQPFDTSRTALAVRLVLPATRRGLTSRCKPLGVGKDEQKRLVLRSGHRSATK